MNEPYRNAMTIELSASFPLLQLILKKRVLNKNPLQVSSTVCVRLFTYLKSFTHLGVPNLIHRIQSH